MVFSPLPLCTDKEVAARGAGDFDIALAREIRLFASALIEHILDVLKMVSRVDRNSYLNLIGGIPNVKLILDCRTLVRVL